MRWFRVASILLIVATQLTAIAMTASIIAMCTHTSHSHSLDGDPSYNGFLLTYILILIFQFIIISLAFFGYWISCSTWRNNYQMDHTLRARFVSYIALWVLFVLGNMGMAIYCIISGKEHQTEMARLYENFAKYNQDAKFVAQLEKFQREKGCCGIYGPDDWLMVQLRSNMGGGGGGGGFQSLDYGFMQNPSTGKCHLLPPTVPMGCGKVILEELHIQLNTYAGFMIMESVIGIIAGSFAGYCFYYWLEREVIVIPEDEISNLIVLEPESSTDNAVDALEYAGSSGTPYLGPPPNFPPGGYPVGYAGSRGSPSYMRSRSYGASGPLSGGSSRLGSRPPPPPPPMPPQPPPPPPPPPPKTGSKKSAGWVAPAASNKQPTGDSASNAPPLGQGGSSSMAAPPKNDSGIQPPQPPLQVALSGGSSAGGGVKDGRSRSRSSYRSKHRYNDKSNSGIPRKGTYLKPLGIGGSSGLASAKSTKMAKNKPHSKNHLLHLQEKALGGKLLGEMHVDHSKDSNPEIGDSKGKKGRKHHATVAIVRNRNPPKPKQFLATNAGHHGQTGHLAEDIAEMTGNKNIIKNKLDDVVLPVEHGRINTGPGGYLAQLELANRRREEEEAANGGAGMDLDGSTANVILAQILQPVAEAHANGHSLEDEERPHIKPHKAGSTLGQHRGGRYLAAGSGHYPHTGSHEHGRYLGASGSHHNRHHGGYLNSGYLPVGSGGGRYLYTGEHGHGQGHYLPLGEHGRDHYLNAASYAHVRSHETNRYIDPGGYIHHDHHHDHHERGSHHESWHYLPGGGPEEHHNHHRDHHHHDHHNEHSDHHRGSHHHGHYLPHGSGHSGGNSGRRHSFSSRHRHHRNSSKHSSSPRGKSRNNNNINNNNEHIKEDYSKKDFLATEVLYGPPPARSTSRYGPIVRQAQVHHHVIHKSRYKPRMSPTRARSFKNQSVRTVVLYKNPRPLILD